MASVFRAMEMLGGRFRFFVCWGGAAGFRG